MGYWELEAPAMADWDSLYTGKAGRSAEEDRSGNTVNLLEVRKRNSKCGPKAMKGFGMGA